MSKVLRVGWIEDFDEKGGWKRGMGGGNAMEKKGSEAEFLG